MKKKFKIQGLDCAHCASKLETSLNKISGIDNVTINFLTQKITIEAADELFEEKLDEIKVMEHKIMPEVTIG